MLRLATPVVVAELGWTAMATVDTLMVGRLSAEAIGAVSLGSAIFLGVTIFGMGLLLGLDTLISQAYGAGRLRDCHRSLIHGIYAALILALPLTAILAAVMRALPELGINPTVLELTIPYLRPVTWSLLPLLLYTASRRYLQATGRESSVMVALMIANVVNALTNWGLVFGKWGLPELGVVGAGWATFASRAFMAVVLLGAIVVYEWRNPRGLFQTPLGLEWSRFRELFALGLPAAVHITLEMGLFSLATALAARLDAASLAAHQIALSVAATTFMVPLGVSSAGAVRVGHAMGARDRDSVAHGGWMAIVFGVGFMGLAAITLFLFPETDHRSVHQRCRRARGGGITSLHCCVLSTLRRASSRHRGRAPRARRYAHAHGGGAHWLLVARASYRLFPLLPVRAWGERVVDRYVGRARHRRRRAARRVGQAPQTSLAG